MRKILIGHVSLKKGSGKNEKSIANTGFHGDMILQDISKQIRKSIKPRTGISN